MNQSWNKPKKVLLHGVGVSAFKTLLALLTTIPDVVVTARYKKWKKEKAKKLTKTCSKAKRTAGQNNEWQL